MKNLILLFVAVVLVGCQTLTDPGGWKAAMEFTGQINSNMLNLKIGMTKQEVLSVMKQDLGKSATGEPHRTEAYQTNDGKSLEYWFYYTQPHRVEVVSDRSYTPVCIIDGEVAGWGRNFYDDTIKIRKEIIRD